MNYTFPCKRELLFITSVNDTGEKFIAGHKNKDAMEVGSCQGKEKVEGDKSAISPAAEVGHGCQWCRWNRQEKLHPKTPHTSWSEVPEAAKTK